MTRIAVMAAIVAMAVVVAACSPADETERSIDETERSTGETERSTQETERSTQETERSTQETKQSIPEELVEFVGLGPLDRPRIDPIELGDDPDTNATMLAELEDAGAEDTDALRETLDYLPSEGNRAFAFVLIGCQETGAELAINGESIEAELTGGGNIDCARANYFLAMFTIDSGAVPDSAHPTNG